MGKLWIFNPEFKFPLPCCLMNMAKVFMYHPIFVSISSYGPFMDFSFAWVVYSSSIVFDRLHLSKSLFGVSISYMVSLLIFIASIFSLIFQLA